MQYTDIMVDIETLSTKRNAAITQLGAVAFNLETGEICDHAVGAFIEPSPQAVISYDTVSWWTKQSDEARAKVFSSPRNSESEALLGLSMYAATTCVDLLKLRWWAMPPSFDLALLEDMAGRTTVPVPWAYDAPRCLRTLAEIAGATKEDRVKPEIAHDAYHDAKAQALSAIKYYKMIKGTL